MTELRHKILGRNRLKDLQPPSYLIPRILPEQGLVTLVAEPSSKKSFLAVHMASCVATGTPFFDIPTTKGNIVYIAAEGQFGMRKRISAWEVEQGLSIADPAFGIIAEPLQINDGEKLQALMASLLEHAEQVGGVSLVVIDTLNRTLMGDENAPRDMTTFVAGCSEIINQLGCAVLLLHHPSKNGNGGARGHSALMGAADVGLKIENGRQDRFTVKMNDKPPKDDEPADDLRLEIKVVELEPEFGLDAHGRPVTSLALVPSSVSSIGVDIKLKQPTQHQVLMDAIPRLIGDNCANRDTIRTQLNSHGHDINEKALSRALSALVDDGVLHKPDRSLYEIAYCMDM